MFKKIINYIEYKKKVRILKMIAVNQLTNFVVNKTLTEKSNYSARVRIIFGFTNICISI